LDAFGASDLAALDDDDDDDESAGLLDDSDGLSAAACFLYDSLR
jgi:hypothetical protein